MNRGTLLAALLVVAVASAVGVWQTQQHPFLPGTTGSVAIQRAGPQSFGLLTRDTVSSQKSEGTEPAASPASDRSSGTVSVDPGSTGPSGYRYVFRGDAVPLDAATVDVLERRVASEGRSVPLGFSGFFPIDLRQDAGNRWLNLTVNLANGFTAYFDFSSGSVSLNRTDASVGFREAAGTLPTLDDAQLIAVTSAFLRDLGIPTAAYGSPVVATGYGYAVPATSDGATTVAPEKLLYPYYAPSSVVYPIRVNGQTAVGMSGEPYGLSVSVDPTTRQVTSVANLATLSYTASTYSAATDFATVRSVAEQGGIYGGASPAGEGVQELTLGTPTRVLLSMYRYDGSKSHDLLVPALRFPVQAAPQGWATAIVVPLAMDLLVPEEIKPVPLPADGGGAEPNTRSTEPSAPVNAG